MFIAMTTVSFCFFAAIILSANNAVEQKKVLLDHGVAKIKENYQARLKDRQKLMDEKKVLASKASEIFTLYEMTKEITKKLSEKEAFDVFLQKLGQSVRFARCEVVVLPQEKVNALGRQKNSFVFALKGTDRMFGRLVIHDIPDEDKDKALILSQQYGLALRRVKLYQEIEALATTDSLTGAYTRRYFMERFLEELKRAAAQNMDLALLMIDVDHFKDINDRYGHLAGDQILKEISRLIKDSIREIDILGRFGGEELSLLLPDTDREGTLFAAERIRARIAESSIRAYDADVRTTVSIGIAHFPYHARGLDDLVEKADEALYRAKKKGRNCVVGA